MKLDEDFSDIKQRIMMNLKTRNLYFKTLSECEKLLDIDLMQLQKREHFLQKNCTNRNFERSTTTLKIFQM